MAKTLKPPDWDPQHMKLLSGGRTYYDDRSGKHYKRCNVCEDWLEREANFYYNESGRFWSAYCHPCRHQYHKTWSREHRPNRDAERRQKAKSAALVLLGGKCMTCGETREQVLDFHHQDSEESKIQRLWNTRRRLEAVLKSPNRYEVLCKNCHYLKHHPNSTPLD